VTKAAGYRSDFSSIATEYATYRTSYGAALFDTIASYARATDVGPTFTVGQDNVGPPFMVGQIPQPLRALDLGCGTGLSAAGLIARGFAVTGVDIAADMLAQARQSVTGDCAFYEARAEALPFADRAFELVTCAQAFHWFDPEQSFGEIARVLRPGGAIALFWKHSLHDDPFEACAVELLREMSSRDEPFNVSRAQTDQFAEFWAERSAFADHEEWRMPLSLTFTVDSFVGYHSSREIARFHLGDRRAEFLSRLRNKVAELAHDDPFAVNAMQYLYLARRR
jgi:ubiquinone/menaquinone biosynthesis C-methylase UbiE